MNRIDTLFKEKQSGILSVYMTAGYPGLEDTVPLLQALQRYGADMVEIGIPFSDPLADGPVIQESSQVSLKNGMSLDLLFDHLSDIRRSIHMPLVLMGYLNPVLQMGMEEFLDRCQRTGIDGVIIPHLPPAYSPYIPGKNPPDCCPVGRLSLPGGRCSHHGRQERHRGSPGGILSAHQGNETACSGPHRIRDFQPGDI